jgi:molecular chaperone DnaK (HSP70)
MVKNNYEFNGWCLEIIKPQPAGKNQIMVKFSMDENGMLTFLAGDPAPHVRIFALS